MNLHPQESRLFFQSLSFFLQRQGRGWLGIPFLLLHRCSSCCSCDLRVLLSYLLLQLLLLLLLFAMIMTTIIMIGRTSKSTQERKKYVKGSENKPRKRVKDKAQGRDKILRGPNGDKKLLSIPYYYDNVGVVVAVVVVVVEDCFSLFVTMPTLFLSLNQTLLDSSVLLFFVSASKRPTRVREGSFWGNNQSRLGVFVRHRGDTSNGFALPKKGHKARKANLSNVQNPQRERGVNDQSVNLSNYKECNW